MRIIDFPACCTAHIIHGFGQSEHAEPDQMGYGYHSADKVQGIMDFLEKEIAVAKRHGESMITVITNSQQTKANAAMLALDFPHSTWLTKPNHKDAKLRLWWVDVQSWKMPERIAKQKKKVATVTSGAGVRGKFIDVSA